MELGSAEHKAQFYQGILKEYYQSAWQDELYLDMLINDGRATKLKDIKSIEQLIEKKEFPSKNAGDKALFVAKEELKHIEQEISKIEEKIKTYWPKRIEAVRAYAKAQEIEIEVE